MITKEITRNAHHEIDHIFSDLFPAHGMSKRSTQAALSHHMLDAILENQIALCDAGTGIGKTYAYLAASVVANRCFEAAGIPVQPVIISTSSIALQNAVKNEYLPILSEILLKDRLIDRPLEAVIRKGKNHYVCDKRLEERLRKIESADKNERAFQALRALRKELDTDMAEGLSGYDLDRICVPNVKCTCHKPDCRYRQFLRACSDGRYQFQICNHNLYLADALRRQNGQAHILPDSRILIMDEAHKLPDTARQMFGVTLRAADLEGLVDALKAEHYLLAADRLEEASSELMCLMASGESHKELCNFNCALTKVLNALRTIQRNLSGMLPRMLNCAIARTVGILRLFLTGAPDMVFYTEDDSDGGVMLCGTVCDLTSKLQNVLWSQRKPTILTSGTLAIGHDFSRFKRETGLTLNLRVTESVSKSPFRYEENCLLYTPEKAPQLESETYFSEVASQIRSLLDASSGHALVLFTSYAAMQRVSTYLAGMALACPVFTMSRNDRTVLERFRCAQGGVLLASGSMWEGIDFPGDLVSMLVIPRLPFSYPDAVKEREKQNYTSFHGFLDKVIVPDMQIKLRQGFGRAIRTESDTCVVAILDERAGIGKRYYKAARKALPNMPQTSSLHEVCKFYSTHKSSAYFCSAV